MTLLRLPDPTFSRFGLKKVFELFVGEAGIFDDGLKSIGVDSSMVGDGYAVIPVGHTDMFPPGDDLETSFAECTNGSLGGNIGEEHLRSTPQPGTRWNLLFLQLPSAGRSGWHL